jgi:flagellar hook assembly protein FlgD
MTDSRIQLKIYDVTGSLVRDFSQPLSDIGYRSSVIWDARDDNGHRVPAGVYFVKLYTNPVEKISKKNIAQKIIKLE